ncbi:T9SS type A sorting domain-containing protein [Flavihumibacter sp. R14]|nr:T9SS type A sorting domain-containing protein [Flavihumibacter soli]
MSSSSSSNTVSITGTITILKNTDILDLGPYNSLEISQDLFGDGSLAGSDNSDLLISGFGEPINSLRFKNLTHFRAINVTRSSGVVFQNSFTVLKELYIETGSKITLPSDATMTIGQNGITPTPGKLVCHGLMFSGTSSSLTLRGNDSAPVYLSFSQSDSSNYTLQDLDIVRAAGAGPVTIPSGHSIALSGSLDIRADNSLNINGGKLYLNARITINPVGFITGSGQSELYIKGSGGDATLRFNPYGDEDQRSLKYLYLNRTSGRTITLANSLNITEQLNVISGKMSSNGFLTLISTSDKNAGINTLKSSGDVLGDVNVQTFFTGGIGMRGTRTLSSPVTTGASLPFFKQLQKYVFITGSGIGEFDYPGSAPALFQYNELASIKDGSAAQFTAIMDLSKPVSPGSGFFLNFRGDRTTNIFNKLNPPYAIPESFAVTYTGPINKGDVIIPASILTYTNRTEDSKDAAYNGYHLIGNPYPSTINWELVDKINMENIVSIIKPGGGMITYSNGYVTNGGPKSTSTSSDNSVESGLPNIQTGQGFYVRAKPGGGTVTFTESCKSVLSLPARLLSEPTKKNELSKGSSGHIVKDSRMQNHIRIELSDNTNADEAIIVFDQGFDSKYGSGDAVYFAGSSVSLSTLTNDGQNVAINFMPDIAEVSEIPLSINAAASGTYSLNFKDISESPMSVFLKDAYRQNELTEVRGKSSYCFQIDKNNPASFGEKRLSLIFRLKEKISTPESAISSVPIYPNPVMNELFFNLEALAESPVQVLIFDIHGRKEKGGTVSKGNKNTVDVSWLSPGIYIARFRSVKDGKSLGETRFIKH